MKKLATWLKVVLLGVVLQTSVATAQTAKPDLTAAYKWLEMLDQGRYFQSWQYASESFKQRIPAAQWDQVLKDTHSRLGAVKNRSLIGFGKKEQVSGLPAGDYLVLKFSSKFNQAQVLNEIMVLTEENGELRVVAYFIQ